MADFEWSITLIDANVPPRSATVGGFFVAADFAAAQATIQGIAEAINDPTPAGAGALPLTLGKITSVKLSQSLDFSTWAVRPTAAAGSENQKGGRFIFGTANPKFTNQMTVPTFNEALKLPTGYIDTANPAVFAFADTAIVAGGGADNHYDDLTALLQAYYTYGGKPCFK